MEKEELKEQMLSAISVELDHWLEEEKGIEEGYEYENRLLSYTRKVNKIILEKSIGRSPDNRNKKNFVPVLEKCK